METIHKIYISQYFFYVSLMLDLREHKIKKFGKGIEQKCFTDNFHYYFYIL